MAPGKKAVRIFLSVLYQLFTLIRELALIYIYSEIFFFLISGTTVNWIRKKIEKNKCEELKMFQIKEEFYLVYIKYAFDKSLNCKYLYFQYLKMTIEQLNTW